MEERRYQIYVSSIDPNVEMIRKMVMSILMKMHHFPVGIELVSPEGEIQWEDIKKMIEISDYYILILDHLYGAIGPEGIGYTEMEYDYAKSLGIPTITFLRGENAVIRDEAREEEQEYIEKLEAFREKVLEDELCTVSKGIDKVGSQIVMALSKIFVTNPRIGLVTGGEALTTEIVEKIDDIKRENLELKEVNLELREELEEINGKKNKIKIDILNFF